MTLASAFSLTDTLSPSCTSAAMGSALRSIVTPLVSLLVKQVATYPGRASNQPAQAKPGAQQKRGGDPPDRQEAAQRRQAGRLRRPAPGQAVTSDPEQRRHHQPEEQA